ncbi:MAG: hypothetical protein P1V97_11900 [Planctomycetota bacterium]|nr:hypothetical protein [Planctomycetota bacterium]
MIGSLLQRIFQSRKQDQEIIHDPCYRLAQLCVLQAQQQNAHRILFGIPKNQGRKPPKEIIEAEDDSPLFLSELKVMVDDNECERCGIHRYEGSSLIPVWFQIKDSGAWVQSHSLPFRLLPEITQVFREHGATLLQELGDAMLHVHLIVTEDFYFAVEIEQCYS